jgi:exopolysaccharide biosynthesis polyprenyl glycosylphosphotransferase
MIAVTLLFMQLLGGYGQLLQQSTWRVILACTAAPIVGLSLVTLVLVAIRNQATSRGLVFSFTVFAMAGFVLHRFAVRWYKGRRLRAGHYVRNLVIVARPPVAERLARHLAAHVSPQNYRVCGRLSIPGNEHEGAGGAVGDLELLGSVGDLGDLLVHRPIHDVLIVPTGGNEAWLPGVIEQCDFFRTTLRVVPEALLEWSGGAHELTCPGGRLELPQIVLRPRYLDSEALFIKRALDILVSGTLLVLLSPLFALIAALIKLTTPQLPVFYPWRVVGYRGRMFTGYKFTTMVADADDRKASLMHLNEMTGPVFKIKDDPRVTRLGRILRKYSLNELPQLWSVLKGDMSLVGPRPAYPTELERYELWHKRKLCVQPGITCLWQVRGRNQISDFDEWVRLDFEYIDRWSLALDVKILLKTVWAVVAGTGS